MYNWESSAKANRKRVKKTGTVVFHPDEAVDLSLDRLLKEVTVALRHRNAKDAKDAENSDREDSIRSALMTPATVNALKTEMGFESLLPCQAQCYRGIFNRRDVILHSRTGSGKTLAYALPIIERHLLLDAQEDRTGAGPFLLIFVLSNDLAVQTQGVLARVYPSLRIGVSGFDPAGVYDVLIGTVRKLDESIRGHRAAAAATAQEEKEKAEEARMLAAGGGNARRLAKRPRGEGVPAAAKEGESDDSGEDVDAESDDGEADAGPVRGGEVSAADVRAIVIDEVDSTLGPRFSNVGRRMKNLLKFIRRANGSLTEGLLSDYRAHHYVLCGATIPNWVIKAGFLGVKKYYYQLVTVGTEKLPESLVCYELACPIARRVEAATELLTGPQRAQLGRVVVFGTHKQVAALDEALQKTVKAGTPSAKKGAKTSTDRGRTVDGVARVLTSSQDEADRIAAMSDFNREAASVLLCTDIAARGLDFAVVDTVLMLSVPRGNMAAETFVHRAGRTARVNRKGQCILMSDPSEADMVDMIVKTAHVVFRKYPALSASAGQAGGAAAAGAGGAVTRYELTVRSQLRLSQPGVKVPTAREVLERGLGGEVGAAAMRSVEEVGGSTEVVRFTVPSSLAHEVKQRLWKYNLKEVPQ